MPSHRPDSNFRKNKPLLRYGELFTSLRASLQKQSVELYGTKFSLFLFLALASEQKVFHILECFKKWGSPTNLDRSRQCLKWEGRKNSIAKEYRVYHTLDGSNLRENLNNFGALFDRRKREKKQRILDFFEECWGDRNGSVILTILIDFLLE